MIACTGPSSTVDTLLQAVTCRSGDGGPIDRVSTGCGARRAQGRRALGGKQNRNNPRTGVATAAAAITGADTERVTTAPPPTDSKAGTRPALNLRPSTGHNFFQPVLCSRPNGGPGDSKRPIRTGTGHRQHRGSPRRPGHCCGYRCGITASTTGVAGLGTILVRPAGFAADSFADCRTVVHVGPCTTGNPLIQLVGSRSRYG